MKPNWTTFVPIVLTCIIVIILFVPTVLAPGFDTGTMMECNRTSCVVVVQYDSISYAYAGWGAYFQTGVNQYRLDGWMCSCPPNGHDCCVPPYGWLIWPLIILLIIADGVSLILFRKRNV